MGIHEFGRADADLGLRVFAARPDLEEEDWSALDETERRIVRGTTMGVAICEVFSPVRVAAVVARLGLVAGTSLDLTNGRDLSKPCRRAKA